MDEKLLKLFKEDEKLAIRILDSINDAIFITDMTGRVLWLNNASGKMGELSRDELIGKNVSQLEKEGYFAPSVTRMTFEAKRDISTVQHARSGRKYIATGHLVKDSNGENILCIAHARDITNVVQNTSKLKEVEELLEKYSKEIKTLINSKKKGNNLNGRPLPLSGNQIKIKELMEKIAPLDTTVLITGETGTGKSFAAKSIHDLSRQKKGPFIEVNCASIPESLLEAELFGYERGTFTGASSQGKIGFIQAAENGTLFLDEIAELPLSSQSKLLHFLQNKRYLPIGARKYISANVRIIAATNKNLEKMVKVGQFRSDLFFRMNILTLEMPELRNNKDDIEKYSTYFLDVFNEKYGVNKSFSKGVLFSFRQYPWPGNLRELENLIERLVVLSQETVIGENDLPQKMNPKKDGTSPISSSLDDKTLPELLEEIERNLIIEAINKTNSTRKAANYLGVSQSLVMRRIKKHNLKLVFQEGSTYISE